MIKPVTLHSNMSYENYIFDLDGTLLNTIDDLAAGCNHAMRSFALPEYTVAQIQSFVGNGVRKLIERCVPQGIANPRFEEIYTCFRQYYLTHNEIHTKPYDGIPDLLALLAAQGKGIAVVSNKFDAATKALVRKYFGNVVTVAIGESEGIAKKPAPDMVIEAMRQLGCKAASTVYIGDSDVDIATARNCGLPCISVLWGFRSKEFLLNHGATTLVSRPLDILKL